VCSWGNLIALLGEGGGFVDSINVLQCDLEGYLL
jgi:hypothetical protein